MMFFLFILNTLYSDNAIITKTVMQSVIDVHVSFADHNTEQIPITRFILSAHRPVYEYRISGLDTLLDENNTKNTSPVEIGKPIRLKDWTLYPIIMYPSYLNKNITISYTSIDITINYVPPIEKASMARSMQQVFKNLILNVEESADQEPLGYLIITPDAFYSEVLQLADWKEKKGWHVTVKILSETGSSPAEIKNFISDAYHNWTPPPEYVLLIGDKDLLPPHSTATPVSYTDYSYTLLDGDDFFAELFIGRLPANTAGELNTMITKIISYEKTPFMDDLTWFTRALMVGANYPIDTMTTPIATKQWVREKLYEYGFSTVDTVYYPPTTSSAPITNAINQGALFVNYRGGIADPDGWVYPNFHNTDVIGLSNGWKLPIVTSITCYTGNFGYPTCFGEAWIRSGSPATPKGAVAFFGASSPSTHSRWNNCLDYGIYWAFLREHIYSLGSAFYRGKMEVFMNFPHDTSWVSGSSFYFHTYNLLGDPSLNVWTGIPDTFIANHASSIPVGTNSFSVQVQNSTSEPVAGALVSLYKENEVKEVEFTNASGYVDFTFTTSDQDTLFVTVTKHNFKPYCGSCLVTNSTVYVGYCSHSISDPAGNNNGEINPGETIELSVTLKNYGTSTTAHNVSAKLTTADSLITIIDSVNIYGTIAAGETASAPPFVFEVSTNAKNSHSIKCNLSISSNEGNWVSPLWTIIQAPEFAYQWHQVDDGGNGILEPGETSDLIVSIKNTGELTGSNITGIIRSLNPGVSVIDSIGTFGTISVNDSSTNSTDHFTIRADSSISPGHPIDLMIVLSGDNSFRDTIEFEIFIGVIDQTTPCGPDSYGYFAYDDTDVMYEERPTYDWVEIDPSFGGSGDTLSLDDNETKPIDLPFSFKFYGDWFTRISICSNGYVAMDSTWIADMYNWRIPAAGGPPLLIAPFWDDLDPNATDSSGNVCYWYDVSNQRFIIEYSRIQHIHDPTNPTPAELQTFEIILFDPQYYVTASGDGEIVFQYNTIANDDIWHNYATVGIENREHTIGLEYTYANTYLDAAAPLANNRAIKFTTDAPDTFPGVEEYNQADIQAVSLKVYPNPSKGSTNIKLQIPNKLINSNAKKTIALNIFDITGRLIKNFSLSPFDLTLPTQVVWDGTDDTGVRVPGGIYFISLECAESTMLKKIIFLE